MSLFFKWAWTALAFFLVFGFISEFSNALLTSSISKSLILEGVYDTNYIITLVIIVPCVFIVIRFLMIRLLLLFPEPSMVSKIVIGLTLFSVVVSVLNNKVVDSPANLAHVMIAAFIAISAGLAIKKIKLAN